MFAKLRVWISNFQEGLMQEALGKIFKDFDVKVGKKLFHWGKGYASRVPYIPSMHIMTRFFSCCIVTQYLAFLSI